MIASFLITFRETLEAALIVGIILAYLAKTKNTKYYNIAYIGIGAGLVGSVICAILFNTLAGGFTGKAEEIFEGIAMLVGSFLLSTMILWMMNNTKIATELKKKVSIDIKNKDKFGLFFLVFISILREGIETVIFLGAAKFMNGNNNLLGAVLGIGAAIILGYLIFVASIKIDIKKFFNISSFVLLLFAAGLTAHGIHELQEGGVIPIVKEHVWDINPDAPFEDQGIYPALHEKGVFGSILKGLFGYNGNPNLLEVIAYIAYIGLISGIYFVKIKSN